MIETLDDLKTHLWRQLPVGKRRRINGNQFADIVDAAVLEFPDTSLVRSSPGSEEEADLKEQLLQGVKRHFCLSRGEAEHNVGSIFTLILLQVAAAIISELVKWWWEHPKNRALLADWKTTGRKRDG